MTKALWLPKQTLYKVSQSEVHTDGETLPLAWELSVVDGWNGREYQFSAAMQTLVDFPCSSGFTYTHPGIGSSNVTQWI